MYERVFADEVDDCESDAVEEEEGGHVPVHGAGRFANLERKKV